MSNPSKKSSPSESHAGPSPARRPRRLAAPALTFDFAEEANRLRTEGPWLQHGKNAVTLVKHPDFRIVLILLKPGARLQEHHASGRISLHTLSGHVRLHLGEGVVDLPAGRLLVLERELAHDVEAVEESAVLVTIAWPENASPAARHA